MRLGFAIAVHVRRGHPAAGRGVRGRRRGVPAQVHRQDPRLQGARRDRVLRLALRACGRAALRAGGAAGQGRGRVRRRRPRRRSRRYHAVARARGESGGGRRRACASGGAARFGSRGCAAPGADGEARERFVSGEPVTIRTAAASASAPSPPPVLSLEVRDRDGSLLGASQADLGELGWDGAPGERELRFTLERLPLGEGEFQLSVALDRRRWDRAATTGSTGRCASSCRASDHARVAPCCSTASGRLPDAEPKVEAG